MTFALLAAAALTSAIAGQSGELRIADNMSGDSTSSAITLRVCNHANAEVQVAVSYIPVGGSDWRNQGWRTIKAGTCNDVIKTSNRTIYARAQESDDASQYWGSDIKQCVEYPGPYDFMTASDDTTCPEGEPQDFTTIHSDGSPVFVWKLNP